MQGVAIAALPSSSLWTQKLPGCGFWIFSPEIFFMHMMLAIHTSTRDHQLWVVSAKSRLQRWLQRKLFFTSAVNKEFTSVSRGGGGHDWCPHLLTDAMSGDDVEGRGQPDSNLVCALYGGLLLPPPQVSRNIKNTFVRACFSSGLVFCMWRWRCASQ